jgi:phosphoenolpyruvate carboxykinase (ATP)
VNESGIRSAYGADKFGFSGLKGVHWNLQTPALYEHSLQRHEGQIVAGGALCAETGHHTGRSPKDKHTVVDELTEKKVWWDNNKKVSKEHFSRSASSPNSPGTRCSSARC